MLPSGASLTQIDAVSKSRAAHILDMQLLSNKAKRFGFPVY
jgi:hypothetical protein